MRFPPEAAASALPNAMSQRARTQEIVMTTANSSARPSRTGRVAAVLAAVVAIAALSGCVIAPYPGPGYYHHDAYWHDRGGYYYR